MNGLNWKAVGIVVTLLLALTGWAYSLGIQRQRLEAASEDISTIQEEQRLVREANTQLAVKVGELGGAVGELRGAVEALRQEVGALRIELARQRGGER